jgi:hypothetical protein
MGELMKKGNVVLANGSVERRDKLNHFLSGLKLKKCTICGKAIKTQADAIEFAIQEASKVPHLEAENSELREKIKEPEKIIIEDREM